MQVLAGTHDKHNEECLMFFLQFVSFHLHFEILSSIILEPNTKDVKSSLQI